MGVAPYEDWVSHIASYPQTRQKYENNRKNYATEADWYAAYGGGDSSPLMTPGLSNNIFTRIYGTYTPPPPPPAPPPAPAAPAPAPAAFVPDPGPALATTPPPGSPPPIGAGGAITGPTTAGNGLGDALGDSVLKPPKYWVGGLDSYDTARQNTGRTTGALKTSNKG